MKMVVEHIPDYPVSSLRYQSRCHSVASVPSKPVLRTGSSAEDDIRYILIRVELPITPPVPVSAQLFSGE